MSSMRLCSALMLTNIAGTFSGSMKRNEDRQTENFFSEASLMAASMLVIPSDISVVGLRSLRVPSTTHTSSWPSTAFFTSSAFVTSPLSSSTFSLKSSGTVDSLRTSSRTESPFFNADRTAH
uniref:Putative secreted protein n=1 Tax=Anopheles darlingi TaxID=43151 RepID=A0A2M4D7D5_ANODA